MACARRAFCVAQVPVKRQRLGGCTQGLHRVMHEGNAARGGSCGRCSLWRAHVLARHLSRDVAHRGIQCATVFDIRLMTSTPATIMPRPSNAQPSRRWSIHSQPTAEISTMPTPDHMA